MEDNALIERFANFLDEIEHEIQCRTVPVCFHCGTPYIRDTQHCNIEHTTWKPNCTCLNKSTIRVVTGVYKYGD